MCDDNFQSHHGCDGSECRTADKEVKKLGPGVGWVIVIDDKVSQDDSDI